MTSLQEQLLPLRKEVARGQGYFFPYLELEQLLTEDNIRGCLSRFPCLREKERDVFRFTSLIRETSLKVFAILAWNGDEAHILEFLYRRETDLKLPYNQEGLYFLPTVAASSFLERQSQFDPVILEVGVIHRTLRSKDVLPFVYEAENAEGGFGKVWRVETYSSCQKLFPVAADSRKGRNLSLVCSMSNRQTEGGICSQRAPSRRERCQRAPDIGSAEHPESSTHRRVPWLLHSTRHPQPSISIH
jgi:hypothetical protein